LGRREWGVAVASKFLAVGSLVPSAEGEVGALATQAMANVRYGPEGIALLRAGHTAGEVVARLTSADEDRALRQLGVVDAKGGAATFTGEECFEWAGGRAGDGFAAQGNILVSGATVDALADTFQATAGRPLAERLLDSLAAGEAAGGDRRGRQSASLLVVRPGGGYGGMSDVVADLRADDHPAPVEELRRLYALHELYFGETPDAEWIDVDAALAAEVRERLAGLGYRDEDLGRALFAWAGVENLEERVHDGKRIDPVVLAELRKR
ncbi:MAG: DUF1028 domain-containing protein, partial [Thermoleophilia bacterium]|nr:DUF1028 domain-containing protein [Thermoleophilia bacterium]